MNDPGNDKNDLDKVAETLAISAKTSLSTASKKKYSKNMYKKTKQKIIEDQKKKKTTNQC